VRGAEAGRFPPAFFFFFFFFFNYSELNRCPRLRGEAPRLSRRPAQETFTTAVNCSPADCVGARFDNCRVFRWARQSEHVCSVRTPVFDAFVAIGLSGRRCRIADRRNFALLVQQTVRSTVIVIARYAICSMTPYRVFVRQGATAH
jgi:hypothetical protein